MKKPFTCKIKSSSNALFILLTICSILFIGFSVPLAAAGDENGSDESGKVKKISVEIAVGAGSLNPANLYTRAEAIDSAVQQYARFYGIQSTASGSIGKIKMAIPVNLTLQYALNEKWRIEAGFDYSSATSSSQKDFSMAWEGFSENHTYRLSYKVSCPMVRLGICHRLKGIDVYGAVGFAFADVEHVQDFAQSEPGYNRTTANIFKVKKTAPGVVFGLKYRLSLKKLLKPIKFRLFLSWKGLFCL